MCYGASFAATNFYITDFLTRVKGFTSDQAGTLLMVSGAVGFLFYMLGGALGERWGRREVLIVTAPLVAPLNLIFLIVQPAALVAIVYFLIYQATNGTWSGAGYAYQAESFPTRVRGTAVGFLSAMMAGGFLIGSAPWTVPDRAHHTDRHLADRRCRHGPRPVAALHPARPGIGGNLRPSAQTCRRRGSFSCSRSRADALLSV